MVAEVVSELEAERGMAVGHTKFMAMIETADAWFRMPEIAKASERIVALTLGGEDFALSVGMLPTAEGLFMPKQQLAIAARAAGVLPWALSAQSRTTRTSTHSAKPCGARAGSASAALR